MKSLVFVLLWTHLLLRVSAPGFSDIVAIADGSAPALRDVRGG